VISKNTILVDPDNNYEIIENSQKMADDFNKANPEYHPMPAQDWDDLNEMFLEAGLLVEMTIQ